jgi:hypothetical protein
MKAEHEFFAVDQVPWQADAHAPASPPPRNFYVLVAFRRKCGQRGGLWLGVVTFP